KKIAGEREDLRKQVQKVIEGIVVSHKQDHNLNGALFAETANGLIYKAFPAQNGKELYENLPLMVSREQAKWVFDFLAKRPETNPVLLKDTPANRQKQEGMQNLLSRLCEVAASIKPPQGRRVQFDTDIQELLERDGKKVKTKLWNEVLSAYKLEFPEKNLRYWKGYFVNRKKLKDVKEEDCKPLEATEKGKGPVDERLRQKLREAWAEYRQQREAPKWETFIQGYAQQQAAKKIRYIPKDQTLVQAKKNSPQFYMPDGYAYCDIWCIP
ncbi:MAG: hypothetical protein AAF975_04745, partial [Spirochaetota bacterium]